jgi:hypothetical protein
MSYNGTRSSFVIEQGCTDVTGLRILCQPILAADLLCVGKAIHSLRDHSRLRAASLSAAADPDLV